MWFLNLVLILMIVYDLYETYCVLLYIMCDCIVVSLYLITENASESSYVVNVKFQIIHVELVR